MSDLEFKDMWIIEEKVNGQFKFSEAFSSFEKAKTKAKELAGPSPDLLISSDDITYFYLYKTLRVRKKPFRVVSNSKEAWIVSDPVPMTFVQDL